MDRRLPPFIASGAAVLAGLGALAYAATIVPIPALGLPASFTTPCDPAITYTIGEIDPRFGISREQLMQALTDASALWNTEAGKPVLAYADTGTVRVNLVYSEHQEAAELSQVISSEQAAYEKEKASVNALIARYDDVKADYERSVARFERDQKSYNEDVAYWNARGGAPSKEYQELEARRKALGSEQRSLERERLSVNALSDEVQSAIDAFNALVEKTNAKVATYNAAAGDTFDQGRYVSDDAGKRITIVEFTSMTELKRVLAHELGHALGMDHVENAESIMYPYDLSRTFALSVEDKAELGRACGLK